MDNNININTSSNFEIDYIKLQKMAFIYNAIHSGWTVKLNKNSYIFSKKHEGKKEIYLDTYMKSFIEKNMNIDTLNN